MTNITRDDLVVSLSHPGTEVPQSGRPQRCCVPRFTTPAWTYLDFIQRDSTFRILCQHSLQEVTQLPRFPRLSFLWSSPSSPNPIGAHPIGDIKVLGRNDAKQGKLARGIKGNPREEETIQRHPQRPHVDRLGDFRPVRPVESRRNDSLGRVI